MNTNCIISVDENGLAHVIKRMSTDGWSTPVLEEKVSAGIYEAYIDGVGNCTIEKQLMITARGC